MTIGGGLSALIPPQKNVPPTATPKTDPLQKEQAGLAERSQENPPEERPAPREERTSIFQIEVSKIKPNPYQPRREYNEEELNELAQSIREYGIIQPLIVSRIETESEKGTDVEYQLISGERRLRAAKRAGLPRVPAVVRREPPNRDKLSLALIENLQRSDLNPVEAARGYARLQDEFQITQREIASKTGRSRAAIANALRLLNLPSHMQKAIETGRLNESQGRALLKETNPHLQEQLFQAFLEGRKTLHAPKEPHETKRHETFWEREIENRLGAPVSITREAGGKGKITVRFFSEEEWETLRNRLTGGAEAHS